MKITSKHTPALSGEWRVFHIWNPRYKDDKVLLKTDKIRVHNVIKFTKAQHLAGQVFYVSKDAADKSTSKMMQNKQGGVTEVTEIPMNQLEDLIYNEEIFK